MRKAYLKILAASLVLLGSFAVVSCSDDNKDEVEEIITLQKLPANAQTFLHTYFKDSTIYKIEKETNGNVVVYEVYLEGGYEVIFSSDGTWTEVDAPDGMTIPDGIVPEVIQEYLNQNYSAYGVNEINRTGQGYKVELNNMQGGDSIDIYFNESGEVINISNA